MYQNPNIETLKAFPYYARLLENETASCCYFVDNMAIYKTDTGKYFYHNLMDEDKEFFFFGQIEIVRELEPVSDETRDKISTLEERNRIISHFDFRLIEIVYEDEQHIQYTIYSEELQVFCKLMRDSFDAIGEDTHRQLAELNPTVNTFAEPLALKLDADGNVLQGVQKNG